MTKLNYHRYLENVEGGQVKCTACGEAGDFFSMHEATCSSQYEPCGACGGQEDSNDCTGWCQLRFLGATGANP